MKKLILSIVAGGFAMALATVGLAEQTTTTTGSSGYTATTPSTQSYSTKRMQRQAKMQTMFQKLNLTMDQKSQIKQVYSQYRPQMQKLFSDLKTVRNQLRSLMGSNYDESKVSQLAKQQGDLVSQLTVMRMTVGNKVFNILTPEQRTMMQQFKQQMRSGYSQ